MKEPQLRVEGIPVYFDTKYRFMAQAEGLWPMRRWIRVGAQWMTLDARAKMGVLYHEAYHIKAWHKWRRVFALLLPIPSLLQRSIHGHEYDADRFAKSKGFGADFARALTRYPEGRRHDDRWFHPPLLERLKRLTVSEDETVTKLAA